MQTISIPDLLPEDPNYALAELAIALNQGKALIHYHNRNWWVDISTGAPQARNVGEMLMLVVTEIAEAMEGHRKSLPDDHLPDFSMLTVELADAIIRILDLAGGLNLPLGQALYHKVLYNTQRRDHTLEARKAPGGKKV